MTATRRELGIGKDQGQARTKGAWMLKPDAFGAMTAILDVPAQRRRKPRGHNGLTGDCRHRDPQDGKSSRNRPLRCWSEPGKRGGRLWSCWYGPCR